MKNLKQVILAFVAFLIICTSGLANAAQTEKGKIIFYGTGWSKNTVRIQTTATFIGQPCATRSDGYVTDPSDPGNNAHQAALLMAYQSNKSVSLVLDSCYGGNPKIIGVYVTNN